MIAEVTKQTIVPLNSFQNITHFLANVQKEVIDNVENITKEELVTV